MNSGIFSPNKRATIYIICIALTVSLIVTLFLDYFTYNSIITETEKHFMITWSLTSFMPYLVFLTMCLGLYSGRVVEILEKPGSNISDAFKKAFSSNRLWIAVLGAPLTFYALWLIIKDFSDPVVMIVYAYQNGFFWQTVTRAIKIKNENS